VVNFPPTMEVKFSTPSRSEWSSRKKSRVDVRRIARSGSRRLVERWPPQKGANRSGLFEHRHQIREGVDHQIDFPLLFGVVLWIFDLDVRGSQNRRRLVWDDNIGVAPLVYSG
jgi:hypothetical protein